MKINVNTKEIQTAFKNLVKVALTKTKIEVLSSVKLTAYGDKVELIATDTEIIVKVRLHDAEIIESGSIVITKDTIKLISKLKDDFMIMTNETIESGKRNIKYKGIAADEFPDEMNNNYINHAFTVSKGKMMDIISITYACGDSEVRPTLKGLNFRGLIVTACDGHRLATKTLDQNEYDKDMIIPAYALDYIPSLTDKKYDGEFTLVIDKNNRYAMIQFDNVTMEIRLIEGAYPDTTRIIPNSFITEVKVNRLDVIEELKIMREIDTDKTKIINIDIIEGKMKLFAESSGNRLTSEMEANVTGEDILLSCNMDFILDALSRNNDDRITFKFSGKTTPFMINNDVLLLPFRTARNSAA